MTYGIGVTPEQGHLQYVQAQQPLDDLVGGAHTIAEVVRDVEGLHALANDPEGVQSTLTHIGNGALLRASDAELETMAGLEPPETVSSYLDEAVRAAYIAQGQTQTVRDLLEEYIAGQEDIIRSEAAAAAFLGTITLAEAISFDILGGMRTLEEYRAADGVEVQKINSDKYAVRARHDNKQLLEPQRLGLYGVDFVETSAVFSRPFARSERTVHGLSASLFNYNRLIDQSTWRLESMTLKGGAALSGMNGADTSRYDRSITIAREVPFSPAPTSYFGRLTSMDPILRGRRSSDAQALDRGAVRAIRHDVVGIRPRVPRGGGTQALMSMFGATLDSVAAVRSGTM